MPVSQQAGGAGAPHPLGHRPAQGMHFSNHKHSSYSSTPHNNTKIFCVFPCAAQYVILASDRTKARHRVPRLQAGRRASRAAKRGDDPQYSAPARNSDCAKSMGGIARHWRSVASKSAAEAQERQRSNVCCGSLPTRISLSLYERSNVVGERCKVKLNLLTARTLVVQGKTQQHSARQSVTAEAARSRQVGNAAQQSSGTAAAEAPRPESTPAEPPHSSAASDDHSGRPCVAATPLATPFGHPQLQTQQQSQSQRTEPSRQTSVGQGAQQGSGDVSTAASRAASAVASLASRSERRHASRQHSGNQARRLIGVVY